VVGGAPAARVNGDRIRRARRADRGWTEDERTRVGRRGLVLGLLGRHPVLRLRSAGLRGACGCGEEREDESAATWGSCSLSEQGREEKGKEEEEDGRKNDIVPLFSLLQSARNIQI
jgi:hypothetical protein